MKKFHDTIVDEAGNIVVGAELYVRDEDDALVTLYSDDGVTETANPTLSGSDGYCTFYTADGVLKFEVFVDGELERTITDYQHYDALDPEIAALRTLTSAANKLPYFTGSGTAALADFTAAGRALVDDADAAAQRTTLGVGTGDSPQFTALNVGHATDTTITRTGAGDIAVEGNAVYRAGGTDVPVADGGTGASTAEDARTNLGINSTNVKLTESFVISCSDETTALATGTGKVTLRMPYAFTVSAVRASLTTAQTSGSVFTVDINEGGVSILSTKLTIDNAEKTSATAAAAPVISDASLADDAEISIDIDQIGDGTAKGLKVVLIGTRT